MCPPGYRGGHGEGPPREGPPWYVRTTSAGNPRVGSGPAASCDPIRLHLFALATLLIGCDAAAPDAGVTVSVISGRTVLQTLDLDARSGLDAVADVSVRLPPYREVPSDPELAERYRSVEAVAEALSSASGEPYGVGYLRVSQAPDAASVALAPVGCEPQDPCVTLVPNDGRVAGANGAVFFPVAEGSDGTVVRLRPFGIGTSGTLTFRGLDGTQDVVAQRLDVAPGGALEAASLGTGSVVRIERESETEPLVVVVQRGQEVRVVSVAEGVRNAQTSVPDGDGPAAVYVLLDG